MKQLYSILKKQSPVRLVHTGILMAVSSVVSGVCGIAVILVLFFPPAW